MEEILYALSDISSSLSIFRQPSSIFRQPSSNWMALTKIDHAHPLWRTRYDSETKLLIEEEDASSTHWGDWKVTATHQDIETQTDAILLAAQLTQSRLAWLKKVDNEISAELKGVTINRSFDDAF